MLPLSLLRNRTFVVINITQALVFFTSGSLLFMFSLFLQQIQGYSAAATGIRFLPMNGAIILAALGSGWVAARLGWRFPVISGLVMAGVATLGLLSIHADTEYGQVLWSLALSGFGGGLTIAPLTSAAMNAVPPLQEGIASAVFNISIQFGGILGIAIQGTLFAQQMAVALRRSLISWQLPADLQDRIITQALHNLADLPSDLPATVSPLLLQQAIKAAFVAGLQATVLVAGLALLTGALLILVGAPSKFKRRSPA
jgi:MFS transporter, DHA2 family, methylenomycin A resistance protein